jgi:hypothetical protein
VFTTVSYNKFIEIKITNLKNFINTLPIDDKIKISFENLSPINIINNYIEITNIISIRDKIKNRPEYNLLNDEQKRKLYRYIDFLDEIKKLN